MLQRLISTWKWKDLIRNLVLRNLRIRYKGSALGFVWTMLNPLLMMLIYLSISLIISAVMNMYNKSVQLKAR